MLMDEGDLCGGNTPRETKVPARYGLPIVKKSDTYYVSKLFRSFDFKILELILVQTTVKYAANISTDTDRPDVHIC